MFNELKRLARKRMGLRKNGAGVSEVLGDILLVTVAIVVVGSIAAQVVNVHKPQGNRTVDFEARLDGNDLVITHMGGPTLQNRDTAIYIVEGGLLSKNLKIQDGFTGTHLVWKIGEAWRCNISTEITHAQATKQPMYVQIIDTAKNQILLEQVLLGGAGGKSFPDIGFEAGSLGFSSPRPDGGQAIDISIKVVNFGPLDVTNVEVRFYDDTTLIGVNKSIANLPRAGQPGSKVTVKLNWTTTYLGRHIINAKVVPKINETNLANNYISTKLNVGFGINLDFTKPNLVVTKFSTSKDNPRTKETVTLKANIGNTAKIQATGFTLKWGDVFQGVNTTMSTTVHVGNITYVNDIDLTYDWTPPRGGTHHLWVHIESVLPSGEDARADADPVIDADWGYLDVQVMPRILLVDDDMAGKGTTRDTATYMKESLKAVGVGFDTVTVGAGDGPQYSGTGVVLQNYDIVIWQTGYESTTTLTTSGSTSDVSNLQKYLDNNGSLWLIGQDVTNDLFNNGGATGKNFLKTYLHVSSQTLDVALGPAVKGNSNCPVTKGMDMNTTVPANLTASPDQLNPDVNSIAAMDNATHKNVSLLYNKSYKVADFAFEFAQIKGMSERAILAYKMLLWFNATVFFKGDDLAVSEVTVTPTAPHYKQVVSITAVIRNNGIHSMKDIKVAFKDVYMGIETLISPNINDRAGNRPVYDNPMNVNMTAMGGMNITLKYWVPEKTGYHQIKVVVDPNDVIQEIDESNNEFVSDLMSTNIYVDSITLLVDDDQTVSGVYNTTNTVRTTLDYLNYKYEVITVPNAGTDGPNLNNLTKYNNVIWSFGNASGVGTTFRPNDMANLKSYLTGYQGNLWVIGQNFLDDTGPRNNVSFRRDLLGVSNTLTRGVLTPSTLIGVKNNNITHGMRYAAAKTFGTAYDADTIAPAAGAEAIFTNSTGAGYGTAFHNTTGVDYKVAVTTFEFSFITDKEDRREFAYMLFHWFGQSDKRIELRVTWEDMYFAKDMVAPTPFGIIKPVLGNSYVLQAKVWNAGNTPAGALVRFLDGSTVISSASIYISASTYDASGQMVLGSELAEVIWSPLFAGNRPISVKVDPDKNIPQTNDPKSSTGEALKKNNNISRYLEVYFFYDDMESGTAFWNHETTLLNINGETPIEYLDSLRPISTNVISKLNSTTGQWTQLFDDGHTMPSSFYAKEPIDLNATKITLRVGICIEDSAEIKTKDPSYLRLKAAWDFINNTMGPGDQVTIYKDDSSTTNLFKFYNPGYGNFENFSFENSTKYLANAGKAYFDNAGNHDLMGCINMGTNDLKDAWNDQGVYPALIVVTSAKTGIGQNDIKAMMDNSRQRGIPLYMVGVGDVDQDLSYDIAAVSNGGLFFYASTGNSLSSIFNILGNIIGSGGSRSIPGSEADGAPSSRTAPPTATSGSYKLVLYNPVGTDKWAQGITRNITYDCKAFSDAECKAPVIKLYNPGTGKWTQITPVTITQSPFKWTSDSSTFDPSGSEKVWQYNWTVPAITCGTCRISVSVTHLGTTLNVTSQAPGFTIFDSKLPLGVKHVTTIANATTQEVDLSNYKSAKLSFWQKYDLLSTENGGVIYIGNSSNKNGPYKWHYVVPKKSYPGNMRMDKTILDDDNNRVLFAYNGQSAGQTGNWAYDEVDLSPFINSVTKFVRVRFTMYAWGYGNGGGWWIDDIKVTATRAEAAGITATMADEWQYYKWTSGVDPAALQPHSGTYMWWNHNPTGTYPNDIGKGIDNSLITRSIDLTNAKDAQFSAYFKFNVDDKAGRPPDGFRVEVSSDNGVSWYPINYGVRAAWGVSGYWSVDGKSSNGKMAYTGIQDGGADTNTPAWVSSSTMWRLNTNLSGWSGSIIKIRFRVITDLDGTHFNRDTIFKGMAIDDLMIRGNTTISGSPIVRPDTTHGPQAPGSAQPDGPSGANGVAKGGRPLGGQGQSNMMCTVVVPVKKDQGDA